MPSSWGFTCKTRRDGSTRVRIDRYHGDKTVKIDLRIREDQAHFLRANAQARAICLSELLRQLIDLLMESAT